MVRDQGITGNAQGKKKEENILLILFLHAFLSAGDNPTWIKQLLKIQCLNIILITVKITAKPIL